MKYIALALACIASPIMAQETAVDSGIDEPITAAGPLGDLAGSYRDAGKDTPVVLIIAGSGPTDRDGNSPLGITANSYKLLAESLAQKGISSVRIDKRGMFGSTDAVEDANAVTIADYVSDVNAWNDAIRSKTNQQCIWVAGHSEGGLIALASAQAPQNICGIITIAAPGNPLDEIIRQQLSSNPANAPIMGDALSALKKLKSGERVDVSRMHPALQNLFNPTIQPYMIDLFSYDPAILAAQAQLPLLIIQGDNDIQVSVKDAEILASANPSATLAIIPKMNHVLKNIESKNRAKNVQSYSNPQLPLSPQLAETMVKFIEK